MNNLKIIKNLSLGESFLTLKKFFLLWYLWLNDIFSINLEILISFYFIRYFLLIINIIQSKFYKYAFVNIFL